ncbi:choice-of-anchor D domain-containing protein [Planctomycetota bacterium]
MEKIKSILVLISLLIAVPCMGVTIIVDANVANNDANFHNIKDAISFSGYGDVIVVNSGDYTGPDNRGLDFMGKVITIRSTNPNDPNIVAETIINCEGVDRAFLFSKAEDQNSIVDGLTITNGQGDFGGGIYCEQSSPTIRNCIFTGNTGKYVGGAIYCDNSSPDVIGCVFIDNTVTGYDGGAIANFFGSSPNVSNCIFINNLARDGGGICNRKNATDPNITNCTFINNTARRFGGGMYNSEYSSANVTNCTLVGNSAAGGAGGIYNYLNGNPAISNCIIWDNSPVEIAGYSSIFTVNYCNIKGGYTGIANINLDPLLADANTGDYHLLPNSPCIDAGDPCGIYSGQTDIDGELRVFGTVVDIGSDEACPDIEVSPQAYDFGDVNIGTSDIAFVTISNFGSANLTVSDISLTPESNIDFSITAGPNLPAAIEPGGFEDVGISYTPSVASEVFAVLKIISDDTDYDLIQISLAGLGVQTEIPPEGQIAEILAFFDESVTDGTLFGKGPGKSAEHRLKALRNMIEAAGDLIEDDLLEEACEQLRDAYNRIDNNPRPPDFAQGTAVPILAEMIENLRMNLGCYDYFNGQESGK